MRAWMADGTVRAIRLICMIEMLVDRGYRAAELAERLQVSRATIYRDLVALQGEPLFVPLIKDGSRWRILRRSALY